MARASSRFVVCAVAKTTTECQASFSISVTLVTSRHLKNIPWEWFMEQDWKSAESLQRFLFYFIALQSALPSLAFDLYLSPWWPLTSWNVLENCPYLVHQTWGWGDGEVKRALTAGSAVFKMQYSLNETAVLQLSSSKNRYRSTSVHKHETAKPLWEIVFSWIH